MYQNALCICVLKHARWDVGIKWLLNIECGILLKQTKTERLLRQSEYKKTSIYPLLWI